MTTLRQHILPALLLSLATAALLVPAFFVQAQHYDTQHHIGFARQLAEHGRLAVPHFLFHGTVALAHKLVGSSYIQAAVAAQTLFALLYVNLGFFWLRNSLRIDTGWAAGLALASLIYNPLTLLYPVDHHLYFGYLYINVYHNPTIWALKPFALSLLILAPRLCSMSRPTLATGIAAALAAGAACLAKPSLTIVLLPALVLLLLFNARGRQAWLASLWILVPSLLCLGWQYRFAFAGTAAGSSAIIWEPLAVLGLFSGHLTVKLLLATTFPLAVLVLFPRRALSWPTLQLAWLTFLGGAALAGLLNETGARANQGNFLWSAQIGLLLLYFTSAALLARDRLQGEWRGILCYALLALHLLNGLVFYVVELTARQMRFW